MMLSDIKKAKLRNLISHDPESVSSLIIRPPLDDSFAEIPWLDIVVAIGSAIAMINDNIDAVEGVFEKLKKLHKWISGEDPVGKDVGVKERVMAILAREYIANKGGLSVQEVSKKLNIPVDDATASLNALENDGIVKATGEKWRFRAKKLS